MTFLTNWVFWAIVIVIVILLAIIGYLAEGTTLGPKNKKKQQQQNNPEKDVEEIKITEENNAPSAWTGEIKKDERHEQVHDVPSIDDWTNIPENTLTENPVIEQPTENVSTELFSEMTPNSTTPSVEPINPGILENLDSPLAGNQPIETIEEPQIESSNPVIEEPVITPEPLEQFQPEQIPEVAPETNNIEPQPTQVSENVQQTIEPAPISDAPIPEQPQTETLEVLEEENKQETNDDNIWK